MRKTKYSNYKHLPFNTIKAATCGDNEAISAITRHFGAILPSCQSVQCVTNTATSGTTLMKVYDVNWNRNLPRRLCVFGCRDMDKRTVESGKFRIKITSVFVGKKTLVEKLFIIADRKLKARAIITAKNK